MAFNKLQGLTLLVTFFVICLLNAKSYDFAEADQAFEVVNEMLDGEMTGEAVEQVSKRLFGILPKMQVFRDPKIIGAIAAALAAVIAGGVVYAKSGKIEDWTKYVNEIVDKRMAKEIDPKLADAEKTKIKDARDAVKGQITALLADSDLKKYEEKAGDYMKKIYTAQKELGVKANELIAFLKLVVANKEATLDSKVEYMKTLKDGLTKADVKPCDETKAMIPALDGELSTFATEYAKSLKAHKDVAALIKIVNLSDKDLVTVDLTAKPEDMKKGSKK